MGMKKWATLCLIGLAALSVGQKALSAESDASATAPYLLSGAPAFDISISEFREKFNNDNPKLSLNEFRAVAASKDQANLTRAATKINENLYASTALERGTLKIKSMQITWLPIQGPQQKAAKASPGVYERRDARVRAHAQPDAKPAEAAETADRRKRQTLLQRNRRRGALCGGGQRRKGADLRC
jgi:predicted nucleic acid-binding protein